LQITTLRGTLLFFGVLALVAHWWVYGSTRVLQEYVGFRFRGTALAYFVATLVSFPVVAVGALVSHYASGLCRLSFDSRLRGWPLILVVLAFGAVGCALAEGAVLLDEARLRDELMEQPVGESYWRARAWPWTDASVGGTGGSTDKLYAND
jgi:hypothetical protein